MGLASDSEVSKVSAAVEMVSGILGRGSTTFGAHAPSVVEASSRGSGVAGVKQGLDQAASTKTPDVSADPKNQAWLFKTLKGLKADKVLAGEQRRPREES